MDQKWLHDGLIVITIFHPELNIERQDLVSAPFAKTEVPFLLQLQTGMRIPSTEVSHYLFGQYGNRPLLHTTCSGDNLQEMLTCFSEKNISICQLLRILPLLWTDKNICSWAIKSPAKSVIHAKVFR